MNRAKFPRKKDIMIISDYPIQSEIDTDIPYSSASNLSLLSDLHKVGIPQSICYTTYLSYERPEKDNFDWFKSFAKSKNLDASNREKYSPLVHQKDLYISNELADSFIALLKEIREVNPRIIIVTGKWSFFFLTGLYPYAKTQGNFKDQKVLGGLSKYRASICTIHPSLSDGINDCIVYPILPAVTKQRQPDKYPICKWDYLKLSEIYQKIKNGSRTIQDYIIPKHELILGETISVVLDFLNILYSRLELEEQLVSVDIETRHATIDCIGICYEKDIGICIPFSTLDNPNYWDFDSEFIITNLLVDCLRHPNCKIIGQNFSYDSAYLQKFWLELFQANIDTMITNHVLYNSFQKSLDFLASVYCENYLYWKDDQDHKLESVSK